MQSVFSMADDVIDRLEHMTLTTDEEEVIAISDDGLRRLFRAVT